MSLSELAEFFVGEKPDAGLSSSQDGAINADDLSRDELVVLIGKRALQYGFFRFDPDRTYDIDRLGFVTGIHQVLVGSHFSSQGLEALWTNLDADGSGKVDVDEWYARLCCKPEMPENFLNLGPHYDIAPCVYESAP